MAESESGQEKTERATPRREQEAREKGTVARSRELNTVALLVAGSAGLLLLGSGIVEALVRVMRASFQFDHVRLAEPSNASVALGDALLAALSALMPLFLLLMAAALLSSVALGGLNFSSKALALKWERVSPFKGLKRIFSVQSMMEMLKSLAKFTLVGTIAASWLWHEAGDFLLLSELSVEGGLAGAAHLVIWSFLMISLGTILVAVIDVPFQLWQHSRQLRMTRQEVRDEMKESDGRPEVKQQIRRLQRELAQRRMMQEVPKADVIVTNPTHFAVALRYDAGKWRAPRVVAKGADLIAKHIREVGSEHRVPVFEAPPLARALFYSTELDHEIPEGLYLAVAQVLAYVLQLRDPRADVTPTAPGDLPIPPDLRRDA